MDRSCGVENVAVVGWVCSFATFVDDSSKRVVFGLCGLRDDPDAKQQRKLVTGIVTFRTTHEPIKYINLFHLYAHKIPVNRNLIV